MLSMLICIKGPNFSVMLGCAQGYVCSGYFKEIELALDKLKIAYNMVDFIRRGSWL